MRRQVESWRAQQLSPAAAKLTIYRAFIEGDLEVPKHLARRVHEIYSRSQHAAFHPRTNVEPVERVHIGIQGTRFHTTVSGDATGDQIKANGPEAAHRVHDVCRSASDTTLPIFFTGFRIPVVVSQWATKTGVMPRPFASRSVASAAVIRPDGRGDHGLDGNRAAALHQRAFVLGALVGWPSHRNAACEFCTGVRPSGQAAVKKWP
jgi:hypothetical protein